ncbi:MAG TPA: hypothetical protein VE673_14830 [Pseudonocardiaceae bacterium]|nr:hypothetical protein [Pseudonocardiaceae bacterium]
MLAEGARDDRFRGPAWPGLTTLGPSWTFTGMFGPSQALHPTGGLATREAWHKLEGSFLVTAFLNAYLVADLFFIVGIAGAVLCAVRSRGAVIVVVLACVADVIEGVVACNALHTGAPNRGLR